MNAILSLILPVKPPVQIATPIKLVLICRLYVEWTFKALTRTPEVEMKKSWSLGRLNFNVKMPGSKKKKDRKDVRRSVSLNVSRAKTNIAKCHSMIKMWVWRGPNFWNAWCWWFSFLKWFILEINNGYLGQSAWIIVFALKCQRGATDLFWVVGLRKLLEIFFCVIIGL